MNGKEKEQAAAGGLPKSFQAFVAVLAEKDAPPPPLSATTSSPQQPAASMLLTPLLNSVMDAILDAATLFTKEEDYAMISNSPSIIQYVVAKHIRTLLQPPPATTDLQSLSLLSQSLDFVTDFLRKLVTDSDTEAVFQRKDFEDIDPESRLIVEKRVETAASLLLLQSNVIFQHVSLADVKPLCSNRGAYVDVILMVFCLLPDSSRLRLPLRRLALEQMDKFFTAEPDTLLYQFQRPEGGEYLFKFINAVHVDDAELSTWATNIQLQVLELKISSHSRSDISNYERVLWACVRWNARLFKGGSNQSQFFDTISTRWQTQNSERPARQLLQFGRCIGHIPTVFESRLWSTCIQLCLTYLFASTQADAQQTSDPSNHSYQALMAVAKLSATNEMWCYLSEKLQLYSNTEGLSAHARRFLDALCNEMKTGGSEEVPADPDALLVAKTTHTGGKGTLKRLSKPIAKHGLIVQARDPSPPAGRKLANTKLAKEALANVDMTTFSVVVSSASTTVRPLPTTALIPTQKPSLPTTSGPLAAPPPGSAHNFMQGQSRSMEEATTSSSAQDVHHHRDFQINAQSKIKRSHSQNQQSKHHIDPHPSTSGKHDQQQRAAESGSDLDSKKKSSIAKLKSFFRGGSKQKFA